MEITNISLLLDMKKTHPTIILRCYHLFSDHLCLFGCLVPEICEHLAMAGKLAMPIAMAQKKSSVRLAASISCFLRRLAKSAAITICDPGTT